MFSFCGFKSRCWKLFSKKIQEDKTFIFRIRCFTHIFDDTTATVLQSCCFLLNCAQTIGTPRETNQFNGWVSGWPFGQQKDVDNYWWCHLHLGVLKCHGFSLFLQFYLKNQKTKQTIGSPKIGFPGSLSWTSSIGKERIIKWRVPEADVIHEVLLPFFGGQKVSDLKSLKLPMLVRSYLVGLLLWKVSRWLIRKGKKMWKAAFLWKKSLALCPIC